MLAIGINPAVAAGAVGPDPPGRTAVSAAPHLMINLCGTAANNLADLAGFEQTAPGISFATLAAPRFLIPSDGK
jgi:hypothetical protein